jgi:hypothetical protein
MPIFLIISRHSAENCPLNNEKMKKMTLELPDKLGGLEKKHGVKRIGAWTVVPEHLLIWVYESPKLRRSAKILNGTRNCEMDGLEHERNQTSNEPRRKPGITKISQ